MGKEEEGKGETNVCRLQLLWGWPLFGETDILNNPCLKHQPELQSVPFPEQNQISGEGDNNLEDILVLSFSCFSYFLLFPTPNQVTFCSLPALLYLIPE